MINRHLQYSVEKLVDDSEFVAWVLYGENESYWNNMMSGNEPFKSKVQKAKEIILLMEDKFDVISVEDKRKMWENIENYHDQLQRQARVRTLRKFLLYAAVIFLVISAGTIASLYYSASQKKYEFISDRSNPGDKDPKLILSNGQVFNLQRDNSSVSVKDEKSILINGDQSVDLQESGRQGGNLMNEVVMPYGNKSMLTLEDGTKVWLNAGSRLVFPTVFKGAKREVYLEGDAYFEVAHDSKRPFIVSASEVSLRVLGTRFYLSSYPREEEVLAVLLEGSVAFKENSSFLSSKNEVVLSPGQKALFTKKDKAINVTEESDPEFYIAWTEGWFQFNKENIYTVFRKLERYYNVEIIYDSTFDSNDIITGKLDLKDSVPDVMNIVSKLADISFKLSNGKIYVDKKNTN